MAKKKSSSSKKTGKLFQDHPNLKWLLIIFAIVFLLVIWKVAENKKTIKIIDQYNMMESMPAEDLNVQMDVMPQ